MRYQILWTIYGNEFAKSFHSHNRLAVSTTRRIVRKEMSKLAKSITVESALLIVSTDDSSRELVIK